MVLKGGVLDNKKKRRKKIGNFFCFGKKNRKS
jgi:hypothetical protein